MVATYLSSSGAAKALWRVLTWPARVGAARRTMSELARMSEYELRDIGLTRSDVNDATALPLDADPFEPARQATGLARALGRRTNRSRGLSDGQLSTKAAKRSRT